MVRCRRGVRGGSSMGKRVQGMVKGWGQAGTQPHSPRSSMAGCRQTTLGEQGGGRVRWKGGRPGAGSPARDHVRKWDPLGWRWRERWGESGATNRRRAGGGV